MKKLILVLGIVLFAGSASAQTAEDVKKLEDYLNNVKSMEALFVQTASNGSAAEGKLYIQKPNKIRMEYAAPVDVLIVGDGSFIVYNDKELGQVTHIDYDDIPAAIILGDEIKIDGKKLRITGFQKDAGSTTYTVEQNKSSELGPITLVFSNEPFELKQWKIIDPQSVEITVSLYDTTNNGSIKKDLFKFKKKSGPGFKGR